MTPRERILAAMRGEAVDYAPCLPTFRCSPQADGFQWTNADERIQVLVGQLGVDANLEFHIPLRRHPGVTERVWEEEPEGGGYPLLHKVIETPKGSLSASVYRTVDWPHGNDIPLMSDFVVSNSVKPWIETEQDMDCFELLWQPPDDPTDQELRERLAPVRESAERWQVPIRATVGTGLTTSLSLFGAGNTPLVSMDKPHLIHRLAEIEHRATMKRIEIAARAGIDFVTRNGFYETTDFWSPAQIESILASKLAAEIALAHEAGMLITYTVCTGIMPILKHLRALPFDCLFGIEPALGNQDMAKVAGELGPDKCIWGGVSAPIHIGEGNPDTVRKAVRTFYQDFGARRTILAAIPSIRPHWPWENVMALVDEWKLLRDQ